MCEPTTIISGVGLAVSAASTISGFMAQNAASAENRVNAVRDMNIKQERQQAQFEQENRAAIQEGFELALEGRAKESTAFTSAVTSGVAGVSVNEMIGDLKAKTARGMATIDQEQEARREQFMVDGESIVSATNSQINAVQPGDPLNAALSIGGQVAGFAVKNSKELGISSLFKDTPRVTTSDGGNFGTFGNRPI